MIDTFELDKEFDKKEIKKLRLKWMKIKLKIPSFKVHHKCHRELEKRLRIIKNNRDKILLKENGRT